MDHSKHSCLMADMCEGVKTDAFSVVILASLTDRAARSQKIHTDTAHDYVTAQGPKTEYHYILTLRDVIPMSSDCVSAHIRLCPAL